MALKINDDLSKVLGYSVSSERIHNLIWVQLHILGATPSSLNFPPNDRNSLARILKQNEWFAQNLRERVQQGQIAIAHFDWIDQDNERQIKWLKNYYCNTIHKYPLCESLDPHLTGKDLIVSLVDTMNGDSTFISSALKYAHNLWTNHLQKDNKYKWLKHKDSEEEKEKCEFTWEWLESNNLLLNHPTPMIKNFNSIMIAFDNIWQSDKEKEHTLSQIKKSWNQSKFRKNLTGKKQVNLILQEKTINALDLLSSNYELSRAEIIELLIKVESGESGHYLEDRKNRRKNLIED